MGTYMLNRYVEEGGDFRPIPSTNNLFWINIVGEVFRRQEDGYRLQKPIGNKYQIKFVFGNSRVKLVNLIQITFKPVYEPDLWWYLHAPVEVIDKGKNRVHPSNLYWRFTNSKVNDNGQYRIPGFSNYLISLDGTVIERQNDKQISLTYTQRDYVVANKVIPDYEYSFRDNRRVPIHRLIALAFLPYDHKVIIDDVNHLNGNKHDYSLPNLEWCSRSENNLHAQRTGLKNDSDVVIVRDLQTGIEIEYFSQAEAARVLGITKSKLSWRLANSTNHVFDDRYLVRMKIKRQRQKHSTSPKISILTNIETGESHEFQSIAKSAEFLNMSVVAVKKRHQRKACLFGKWYLQTYSPEMGERRPDLPNLESINNQCVRPSGNRRVVSSLIAGKETRVI